MSDPVLLIIDALAVFRLSRLIVADSILDTPRAWLLRRWPGDDTEFYDSEITIGDGAHWIMNTNNQVVQVEGGTFVAVKPRWFGKWLSCVWCVSPYVAVGVVAARVHYPDVWQWVALAAAMSAVAGWIHTRTV